MTSLKECSKKDEFARSRQDGLVEIGSRETTTVIQFSGDEVVDRSDSGIEGKSKRKRQSKEGQERR